MTAKLHAAGVLAGAYRGRNLSERNLLNHAVSDAPIRIGRLSRGYGEALCDRSLDMVDSGAWEDVAAVTCPKCVAIVARWAVRAGEVAQ